jgi:hypothetical protein
MKCNRGYRIRLVLVAEARLVDSMAITMSHRIAAIHAFRRLSRSVFKRQSQYAMGLTAESRL